jgi:release factor glutamine methyltransferase
MVDARVLVPRPETETVVEVALERAPEARRIVDVGTGSGAIALALKAARPDAEVWAVDRSPDALEVARSNSTRLNLALTLVEGDLLDPLAARAPFDLVVSNPPYIEQAQLPLLPKEVQREPRQALDGGADGLDVYRRLIPEALPLLESRGVLVLEVGAGQAPKVMQLMEQAGYQEIKPTRDLASIERVVSGLRPQT